MNVFVKLIGTYRDHLPKDAVGNIARVNIPPGETIAGVLTPFNIPLDAQSVIVLNGLTVDLDTQVEEGDTITAFSAIAGG